LIAHWVVAIAAAGLLSAAQAQELKTVRIGVVNLSTDVAFYIAEKPWIFQAGGAQGRFHLLRFRRQNDRALGSGALDAGGGATSAGLYNAVERGIELRIVADKE